MALSDCDGDGKPGGLAVDGSSALQRFDGRSLLEDVQRSAGVSASDLLGGPLVAVRRARRATK